MRLFPKFLLTFLLIALAPLAFVGTQLVRETESSLGRTAMAVQQETALRAAEAVARRLEKTRSLLALARRNPDLTSTDARRREGVLAALMASDELAENVSLYDAVGRPLGMARRSPRAAPPPAPDWDAARPALLERGAFMLLHDGWLTFHAAVPAPSGALWGVLTLNAKAAGLSAALTESLPDASTLLTLSDKDAVPLAAAGDEDASGVDIRVPVPEASWNLTLRRPAALIFEPVRRARRRLALALAAAAAAAAAACLIMAMRLSRPLLSLREAVRRMRDGDFHAPVPPRTGDELGDLAADVREAQAALEKRTRDAVLGRMARMIGHDLRSPLQALEAAMEPLKEASPRRARAAQDALDAAKDFVEQILAVGRNEALVFQPSDVNALVKEAAGNTAALASGPRISVELAEKLPFARLDPAAARRALVNVLNNAREAATSRVTVATEARNGTVSVVVTDDGPGIPDEKKGRLFEEFSTKPGGHGLGLMVVKKVMDQHGGAVSIESRRGSGTSVRLDFPRHGPQQPLDPGFRRGDGGSL